MVFAESKVGHRSDRSLTSTHGLAIMPPMTTEGDRLLWSDAVRHQKRAKEEWKQGEAYQLYEGIFARMISALSLLLYRMNTHAHSVSNSAARAAIAFCRVECSE